MCILFYIQKVRLFLGHTVYIQIIFEKSLAIWSEKTQQSFQIFFYSN